MDDTENENPADPNADTSDTAETVSESTWLQRFFAKLWGKIRPYRWLIFLTLSIILFAFFWFTERDRQNPKNPYTEIFNWFSGISTGIWGNYRHTLTLLIIIVIVIFLIQFRSSWLPKVQKRTAFSIIIFGLLFSLATTYFSNRNTLVISNVEISMIGSEETNDETLSLEELMVANQLRGSLNSIGLPPFDTVSLTIPGATRKLDDIKRVQAATVNQNICTEVMSGPSHFDIIGNGAIILPRAESDIRANDNTNNTGGQQDLKFNTVVGTLSLSLDGVYKFLLDFLPNNNRELSIQVIQAPLFDDPEAVRVIINANDGKSWTVSGPQSDLPHLLNFLSFQLVLNNFQDSTGTVSPDDLAMTLGNQAFNTRDFTAASAYYRLAETLRPQDLDLQIMLGLTKYQLSQVATGEEKTAKLESALNHFNRAQLLNSNNTNLFIYRACVQSALGKNETAVNLYNNFNESLNPGSRLFREERLSELEKRPPLGPGRYIAVQSKEPDEGHNIYFLANGTLQYDLDYNSDQPTDFKLWSVSNVQARQISATDAGVYVLSTDGLVYAFEPTEEQVAKQLTPIITQKELYFQPDHPGNKTGTSTYTGGIRQIFAQDDLLYVVGRLGQVIRMDCGENEVAVEDAPMATEGEAASEETNKQCHVTAVTNNNARQIVPDGDHIYILKEDRTVWRVDQNLENPQQLVNEANTREIIAQDQIIYGLNINGNIWRYIDDDGDRQLSIIDTGKQTSNIQIIPQGLLVLKNDGKVHLLTNLEYPTSVSTTPEFIKEPIATKEPILTISNGLTLATIGEQIIAVQTSGNTGLKITIPENGKLPTSTTTPTPASSPSATPLPTATLESTTIPTPTAPIDVKATLPAPPTSTATPVTPASETSTPIVELTETAVTATGTIIIGTDTPVADLVETAVATATATHQPTPLPTNPPQMPARIPIQSESGTTFDISRTEITNQQYLACVAIENGCNPIGNEDKPADQPVVNINYTDAVAYCYWTGGVIPTTNEWRLAVSTEGLIYPWGNSQPTCEKAVITYEEEDTACSYPTTDSQPVGSVPAGQSNEGVMDLIGNVWEWTATTPQEQTGTRIVVGGSWSNPDGSTTGGFESFNPPNSPAFEESYKADNLGFRCIYRPDPEE